MIETIEYLKNQDHNTWMGIAIISYLIFEGIKSLIQASRSIDEDK